MVSTDTTGPLKDKRFTMRMYNEDFLFLTYWANALGVDKSELMVDALRYYISHKNQDFDVPSAVVERINQMVDAMESLATEQRHTQSAVYKGMDSIMGIMRGANYLTQDEDGDL